MTLNDFHYPLMRRLALRWETRSLGTYAERLMFILPPLIHASCEHEEYLDESLRATRDILSRIFNDKILEKNIFERVILRLKDYASDAESFSDDYERLPRVLSENITMFSIAITLLSSHAPKTLSELKKSVLQKYDEKFKLDKNGERLLRYQEKYIS